MLGQHAFGLFRWILVAAALSAAASSPAFADDIERQRELFRQVFATVERGDWSVVTDLPATDRENLENYVLWPDLRAAWFRANIRKTSLDDVAAFLDQHGTLKPARELRYRYALELARRGELDRYFGVYQSFYQGLEIPKLDCLALQAEIEAGRSNRVLFRARDLWLVGESQVEECDPVFEHLRDKGEITVVDYQARYKLAIEAREFSLARWLGKSIDDAHAEAARVWMSAQSNPEQFLRRHKSLAKSDESREQLAYAAERLTYADPELALDLWNDVHKRYAFSEEQKIKTSRHIALWTARDRLPDAYLLLKALPAPAQDDEVTRWRARTSLRQGNWRALLLDIDAMSGTEQNVEEWRYWRAVALQRLGQVDAANAEFGKLAAERSYYGFLAADELGIPYSFEHTRVAEDDALLVEMAARADLIRARELFLVGLDGRGRSEWQAAISYLTPRQKLQAAILAHRWGWHSRAIATAASVGEYDDLTLRYPLPYRTDFEQHATSARISTTWAYGIARSESLFMRDVRSSAGAIGLMQLMPATGRSVASAINLPYSGLDTLTDPNANIRLGTTYLSQMSERYDGNRILATAAYNAGPHRVDRWMPQTGTVDARIWIENIPFNETRSYVRRVMAAKTIFEWRLTGKAPRISESLISISAPTPDAQTSAYNAPR